MAKLNVENKINIKNNNNGDSTKQITKPKFYERESTYSYKPYLISSIMYCVCAIIFLVLFHWMSQCNSGNAIFLFVLMTIMIVTISILIFVFILSISHPSKHEECNISSSFPFDDKKDS